MDLRMHRRALLLGAAGTAAAAATGLKAPAYAQNAPIKLGWLATLEGPFATGGQDGFRCMQMLLEENNNMAGGRRIEVVRESSNAQADVALARARKLVEQDNVDIVVAPLGRRGHRAPRLFPHADGQDDRQRLSGAPTRRCATRRPNFFRFNTDGTQWMAGLGNYVRRTLNVQEVAVVAGDYAFPYSQAFGFSLEFCRAGGRATYIWSPLGTTDYSSIIARIPRTAGALVVIHGGSDGLAFMTQYAQAGGSLPLIGGSIMADQSMLSARGPHRRLMVGMVSAGPIADVHEDPMWNDFVARYRRRWANQGGFNSPSIHGFNFYTAQQAVLLALNEVRGDLSGNQAPSSARSPASSSRT
jgi:branched-chain amino acid transport system substrate-binding protein